MTTEPKKKPVATRTKNIFSNNRWLILGLLFAFILYLLSPVLTPFLIAVGLSHTKDSYLNSDTYLK